MGTIFVAESGSGYRRPTTEQTEQNRADQLHAIGRYLYGGSEYISWGSDPCGKFGGTGFLYDIPEHAGFGPDQTLDRLASGLHFGHREESACATCDHPKNLHTNLGCEHGLDASTLSCRCAYYRATPEESA